MLLYLKLFIRKIFSNYILPYKLYYNFILKREKNVGELFSDSVNIFIDGYPRSGNTLIKHLAQGVFPNLVIKGHLHKVAPLKISIKKKVPAFILIRHPLDAVSSLYLMQYAEHLPDEVDKVKLQILIKDYIDYYEYVVKKIQILNLIFFNNLISNYTDALIEIKRKLRIDKKDDLIVEESKVFYNSFSETKTNKSLPLMSKKPHPEKEKRKDEIKVFIQKMSQYTLAVEVFKRLEDYNFSVTVNKKSVI